MKIRAAAEEDCKKYFEWVNDAAVRQSSLLPESVEWSKHVDWFHDHLMSDASWMYVAVDEGEGLIGQIRFDLCDESTVEVDLSIAPEYRNLGFGAALIKLGVDQLSLDSDIRSIVALVKPSNEASLKAFTNSGFSKKGSFQKYGVECVRLVCELRSIRGGNDADQR